jgi:hypothetical protein
VSQRRSSTRCRQGAACGQIAIVATDEV